MVRNLETPSNSPGIRPTTFIDPGIDLSLIGGESQIPSIGRVVGIDIPGNTYHETSAEGAEHRAWMDAELRTHAVQLRLTDPDRFAGMTAEEADAAAMGIAKREATDKYGRKINYTGASPNSWQEKSTPYGIVPVSPTFREAANKLDDKRAAAETEFAGDIEVIELEVDPATPVLTGLRRTINDRRLAKARKRAEAAEKDAIYDLDLGGQILRRKNVNVKPDANNVREAGRNDVRPQTQREVKLSRRLEGRAGKIAHAVTYRGHMERSVSPDNGDSTRQPRAVLRNKAKSERIVSKNEEHLEHATHKYIDVASAKLEEARKKREKVAELERKRIALEKARRR